jgi:hypothetical protein
MSFFTIKKKFFKETGFARGNKNKFLDIKTPPSLTYGMEVATIKSKRFVDFNKTSQKPNITPRPNTTQFDNEN